VAEIVKFPRFLGTHPGSNLFLIDEDFDRSQISTEVSRIGIRFHQLRWRDLGVPLSGGWQPMSKPKEHLSVQRLD
jgi:hypothetical protein